MASGSGGSAAFGARRSVASRVARRWRHGRVHVSLWLLLVIAASVIGLIAGMLAAPVDFTPPAPPRPVLIADRSGALYGEIRSPEQREDVTAAQIPAALTQAVVAAEDKRFFSHRGVDPAAIGRAIVADVTGKNTQGGSTITQQYVKQVYVGTAQTFLRKLREAALSVRLEQRLSKTEILTRYLNIIPLGEGTFGVQAASKYYFGVPVSQLTLAQASMLAGLIPAPSLYNPVHSLALARERQLYVLNRMVDNGDITSAKASQAYLRAPQIVAKSAAAPASTIAPQYTAAVTAQVKKRYSQNADTLYRSGLTVRTTLDRRWQQALNDAVTSVLPAASDPEAAVIAIDYRNGDILGLSDKVDASHVQYDPATLAVRTSGSTIKPFTLAVALSEGQTLDTAVYGPASKSYPVSQCGTPQYTIRNDEGGGGSYTLKSALAQSVNTVYGPLAITVGTPKVAQLAYAAGLRSSAHGRGALQTNCAMGLGVGITPISEAVAFATLADGGVYHPARYVTAIRAGADSSGAGGGTLYTAPDAGRRVLAPTVAGQVVDAMRDVVRYGTGTAAQQPGGIDVFGKTGTTDGFTDAWFSGCVPAYHVCLTTWMGYDTPGRMSGVEGVGDVFGGTLPAKIFATAMDNYRAVNGQAASQ